MLQRRLKFSFDVLSLAIELLCQLGVTIANTFSALTLKLILGSMEIGAFGSVRFASKSFWKTPNPSYFYIET
jgi:hypothetical protein